MPTVYGFEKLGRLRVLEKLAESKADIGIVVSNQDARRHARSAVMSPALACQPVSSRMPYKAIRNSLERNTGNLVSGKGIGSLSYK